MNKNNRYSIIVILMLLSSLTSVSVSQSDVAFKISETTINQTIGTVLDSKALNFSRFTFSFGVSYYGVNVNNASVNLVGGTGNNMELSLNIHGRTNVNLFLFNFDIVANASLTMYGRVDLVPQGQGYKLVFNPQGIRSFTLTNTFLDALIQDVANGYIRQQPEISLVSYTSLLPAIAAGYFVSGTPAMTVTDNEVILALALGPPSVTITGPSSVYHPAKGTVNTYTWSANVNGGAYPFTYVWYKTRLGTTYQVGTSASYSESFSFDGFGGGSTQFSLKVDVRDAYNQFGTASKNVTEHHSGGIEARRNGEQEPVFVSLPQEFDVAQNYPNPFNPEADIRFDAPEAADVRIAVFDLLGREVTTLLDGRVGPGRHVVRWNGRNSNGHSVASGVYLYRMVAFGESGKQFTKIMKMTLTK